MKRLSYFALLAALTLPFTARAQSTAVRIEVKVDQSSERKDIKGSSADEKTPGLPSGRITGSPSMTATRTTLRSIGLYSARAPSDV